MNEAVMNQVVFDDSFRATSLNADNNRLNSIELLLTFGERSYLLNVESLPIHLMRAEMEHDEPEPEEDPTYVIACDELLPTHLLEIKHKSFEDLKPFLIEQETE